MTELITHLEAQVASAERLLANVLAQREAIKTQDVAGLLARLGDIQGELLTRRTLELERDSLINAAAGRLSVAPDAVDLDALLAGMPAAAADHARTLGTRLRDVLAEVSRVHGNNRVLIRQELSFLDHLLRALSGTPQSGYSVGGWATRPQPVSSVNARV